MDLLRAPAPPLARTDVDRALDYIRSRALVTQYAGRGQAKMKSVEELAVDGRLRLEFQDWALMDGTIPSTAGRERDASATKTVDVCHELGLLRLPPGTLQTHGAVLCHVCSRVRNPPCRGRHRTQSVFLQVRRCSRPRSFTFSDQTGDSCGRYFGRSGPPTTTSLSLATSAHGPKDCSPAVEGSTDRTAANREEFRWLDRQRRYAKRLADALRQPQAEQSVKIQSAYRPIEDLLLPRLEFLVDVGALAKPRPADFTYILTERGEQFYRHLSRDWDIERDYFRQAASLLEVSFSDITGADVLAHLQTAYADLRNTAGYAPIEETVLLANARTLVGRSWHGVELAAAKEALADAARTSSSVRIVSDRHRRPGAFRIR